MRKELPPVGRRERVAVPGAEVERRGRAQRAERTHGHHSVGIIRGKRRHGGGPATDPRAEACVRPCGRTIDAGVIHASVIRGRVIRRRSWHLSIARCLIGIGFEPTVRIIGGHPLSVDWRHVWSVEAAR